MSRKKKKSARKKSVNPSRDSSQNSTSRKNMTEGRSNPSVVERNTTSSETPSPPSVFHGWLIIIIIVLCLLVVCLLPPKLECLSKEIFIWVLFTLLATALSCGISAFISHRSQKVEENKENKMMEKISEISIANKNNDEITSHIKIALEKSSLACGNQDTILRMLMDWSLDIGGMIGIRILAHTSDSFSGILTKYFDEKKTENKFDSTALKVLIHDQNINKESEVVKEWLSLCEKNEIGTFEIRKTTNIVRRSFFGMIIEFTNHHSIGLIGFYEPQDQVKAYKYYGVFSEDSSLLSVLDKYFEFFFVSSYSVQLETREKSELTV